MDIRIRRKRHDIPSKTRHAGLNIPLCYDREMKDLPFFYKALQGFVDVNVKDCISFVEHGRTRHSQTRMVPKTPRTNHRYLPTRPRITTISLKSGT